MSPFQHRVQMQRTTIPRLARVVRAQWSQGWRVQGPPVKETIGAHVAGPTEPVHPSRVNSKQALYLAPIDVVLVESLEVLRKLDVGEVGSHGRVQKIAQSSERSLGVIGVHVTVQSEDHRGIGHDAGHPDLLMEWKQEN